MLLGYIRIAATFTALSLLAACTSKKSLSPSEISKNFPDKPAGSFVAYSAKDMKRQKLTSADFSADVSVPSAIDPRLDMGMKEIHQKKYLLPSGIFEWNEKISVGQLTRKSVQIQHDGQLINYEKGTEVSKQVECHEETLQLSSGVVQRELKCSNLSVVEEAKDIGAIITGCMVEPVGTRPVKTNSIFGRMILKNDKKIYSRVTKEIKTISGDVICDGDKLGMGTETRITYYTNEEANVGYPAVGSHKLLFQSRSVVKSTGDIVYKSSDEITEVSSSSIQASTKKTPKIQIKKKVVKVAHIKSKRTKLVASHNETDTKIKR